MKACDLYVQTSNYEGKAVTVREAQILSKPVLITNFPTASSQVENGIDGYICGLGANGVAAGIEYMINHPESVMSIVENLKNKDFSNKDEIEKIYNLIEK